MMSYSTCYSWQNLPDLILSDIMLMVGVENIEDLHKCRQVCRNWKVMIYQMTRGKKDTIRRKAISLESSRQDKLALDPTSFPDVLPTLACLAHHGFLSRIREWELNLDMDLGLLPTHYLPSLASSIWGRVRVHPLNSCDLSPFLDSFKGEVIYIDSQFLDDEETRALERNFKPCSGSKIWINANARQISDFHSVEDRAKMLKTLNSKNASKH